MPGFHIPDFAKERYDGDPLMAHLAIKYLRDIIDADHCAYLFDKNHELEDLSYLEGVKSKDVTRRKSEILAFDAIIERWKDGLDALLNEWMEQGATIEAMAERPGKNDAVQAHWILKTTILEHHPEPKQGRFEPQLLTSEAALLAAREIENKRRKDDADRCLGRFKALAGNTITTDLSKTWDDPRIPSIEKAIISFDYFLQCQHTDAEGTVARLTADMNALHPATTVHGGRVLYQKMSIINETLSKVGPQHVMSDSVLIATIRTKLQGDAFDNLKFFHKQADGNTRPIVRSASLFGTPVPERPGASHVSWVQLGTNLIELSETKSTASFTSLEAQALAFTQEEPMALYAGHQHGRYPPPPSYQSQPRRSFVPAAGPPAWLSQSRPFQNLVQPLVYNRPAGAVPTPYSSYLQAHQQQQQQARAAKAGGQPPPPSGPMTAGRAAPTAPGAYGAYRQPHGAQIGGRGNPRQSRPPVPVYGPSGDLRCYMVHDDDADASSREAIPQHDHLIDDGTCTISAAATSEGAAAAYSVQESDTQLHPTQAPYYVDEYGYAHYFG